MAAKFTPVIRPPIGFDCTATVPRPQIFPICNPQTICSGTCIDVVLEADQAFPQWYVGGVVDVNLQTLVSVGTAPIVWAVSAGALPSGLVLEDGHVVGTVEAAASTGSVTFTATNCEEGSDSITLTWDVNACTEAGPVLPAAGDIPQPVVGVEYEVTFTATGTAPIVFTIDPLPPGATFDGETGVLNIPAEDVTDDEISFTVTAQGPCGPESSEDYTIQGTTAILLRYGNLTFDPAPAAAPTFIEGDFTGGGPLFASYDELAATSPGTRVGNYAFPGGDGVRQVMWIADSLLDGAEFFTVSGLDWVIDPAPNTALQSLTIAGIPGKVYFTANQLNGSYTLHVG